MVDTVDMVADAGGMEGMAVDMEDMVVMDMVGKGGQLSLVMATVVMEDMVDTVVMEDMEVMEDMVDMGVMVDMGAMEDMEGTADTMANFKPRRQVVQNMMQIVS